MESVRIAACRLYRYRVPLVAPLPLKGITLHEREGVIVVLQDKDRNEGWGEVAPLPGFSRETLTEATVQVASLAQSLVGQAMTKAWLEPTGPLAMRCVEKQVGPAAQFGLGQACADLWAKRHGQVLPAVLTEQPHPTVALNSLLVDTGKDMKAAIYTMREAGYRAVKLKVGRRAVEEDLRRVREVAALLGPEMQLRLDANRAWTYDQACTFAESVSDCAIAYVEEPLRDAALLPQLVAETALPVALDESLVELSPEDLVARTYATAIIIKPTLATGWWDMLAMMRAAQVLGIDAVLSASFEAGVGIAGLVALAASYGRSHVPMGFDTYRWLADDVVQPRLPLPTAALDVGTFFETAHTLNRTILERIYA